MQSANRQILLRALDEVETRLDALETGWKETVPSARAASILPPTSVFASSLSAAYKTIKLLLEHANSRMTFLRNHGHAVMSLPSFTIERLILASFQPFVSTETYENNIRRTLIKARHLLLAVDRRLRQEEDALLQEIKLFQVFQKLLIERERRSRLKILAILVDFAGKFEPPLEQSVTAQYAMRSVHESVAKSCAALERQDAIVLEFLMLLGKIGIKIARQRKITEFFKRA